MMARLHMKKLITNIYTVSLLIGILIGFWTGCRRTHKKANREVITRKSKLDHELFVRQKLDFESAKDVDLFSSRVTVVTFCEDEHAIKNLNRISNVYPKVQILFGTREQLDSKAEALNELIKRVDTEYFLHLDEYHQIDSAASEQSVGWLLETLEEIKSLDIVGGSVLVEEGYKDEDDSLEIPCYRLHHYNYTYWETYEYEESILDIMVCQRTSTSFLANTTTFKQSGLSFDPRVKKMLFEDFFLEAKKRGLVVGTKPEVYFTVPKSYHKEQSAIQHVVSEFVPDLIPFGLKHQVMTIVDINKQTLYICERYSLNGKNSQLFEDEELLCDYGKTQKYWQMEHWAYGGMYAPPTMMFALKRALKISGDFFDEKGWTWGLAGGAALGAVKLRGLLPWEAGDIDLNINVDKKECLKIIQNEFIPRHPDYEVRDFDYHEILIRPKEGFGGYVTIFFNNEVTDIKRSYRMSLDGYQASVPYQMFKEHRAYYGVYYLQHKQYKQYFLQPLQCSEDSNTCLPDYSKLDNGRGGMWKEFFVEK